jgi:hypothetical protein
MGVMVSRQTIQQLIIAAIGVLTLIALRQSVATLSEYITFYAGAKAIGTPFLYDMPHGYRQQIAALGGFGDQFLFVRIPFCALLHWPLSLLPYAAALHVWHGIWALAVIAFLLLWNIPNRAVTLIACCWSMPLVFDFVFGKDTILLALLIVVAFRLKDRSALASGLVLSALSIKFHLFFLLPVLFLAQKRWKMTAGFGIGAAAVTGISFVVGGFTWPVDLIRLLRSQSTHNVFLMLNTRGLLASFTESVIPELILGAIIAGVVWSIIHRSDFEYGLATVLVGSLLVSHHAGFNDSVILIPALLIVLGEVSAQSVVWWLAILFLTPAPYIVMTFGPLPAAIVQFTFIALLGCMSRVSKLRRNPDDTFASGEQPAIVPTSFS